MISIVILTKNNEKTIEQTLFSTKNFKEIIILDTGSIDKTLAVAQKYKNVKIFKTKFLGFGKLRNLAAKKASYNWILSLDSDEIISKELELEIFKEELKKDFIYFIPFKNFYNNKHIKWCGWHKESHPRLYHKENTSFKDQQVHEKLFIKDKKLIKIFKNPIYHYPYQNTHDFLEKMQKYSTLFASQNKGKIKSSFSKALFHGAFAFFKSFILKKGLFGGKEGFIISFYNANTAFYKYLKLYEINKK